MKYNQLNISAHKSPSRVGRGISAGGGKTAGRGTKGQKSRTGSGRRPGFEGGQNPLVQRLPKLRGFHSHRTPMEVVYTGQLDNIGVTVDNATLAEAGLASNPYVSVKLIVKGDVSKKHTVSIQAASTNAIEAIQKAGGTFKAVPRVGRSVTKTDKKTSE
ncbi:MAG TPA: 50S ribosomal protein L15 [Candidatus Saccharimonadales bacterium]|nr:50S ribosomal protein L15 [Candidatus Saccharimonadales bacterium]